MSVDCVYIPELSKSEWGARLHAAAIANRTPLAGSLDLTERCNINCVHCYIAVPANDERARGRELSLAEWCQVIDQIVDEGCLWLLLTGGEVLVRPDFLDIYAYARRKGLITTVFTNGTLITERIADFLADLPPHTVEITLYGLTQQTYERVTRVPGSHSRCMRGIELLLERNIHLKLKTVVMTLNHHELPAIRAYCRSLGVDFRFDPFINPGLNGARHPVDVRLSPEEIVQLEMADEERWTELVDYCEKHLSTRPDPEKVYICGAGLTAFHIDAYGKLSPCIIARRHHYDLRQGSFREGWREVLSQIRMQKRTQPSPCPSCKIQALCQQCPGWSQLEHGDDETLVAFLHETAYVRARMLGLEP